ncbi:MAG: hypothetical protein H6797_02000 [Candidatus Nomurabacteria bacterium]|nr:MAG: hypothetical protein H6797_02000 [Candidatus Nomurabacteria bacterium]
MARLPTPGGDTGNWGSILNNFLEQIHAPDGKLKTDSVTSDAIAPNAIDSISIADGSITETLLDTAVQTKLNATAPVTSVAAKTGAVSLTKTDVGLDQVDNTSDATKNAATATLTNKTLTDPKVSTIKDTNNNTILSLSPAANAVNYLQITNRYTGAYPLIQTVGADANIGVTLIPKGSGPLRLYGETGQTEMAISATSTAPNTNLNLTTQGTGTVRANGVDVLTVSGTQTLTNKTISGSNNTITNIPASSLPDASRLVVTTVYGSTGPEDGPNTWTKIATFSTGSGVYRDVQVVLQVVAGYGAYGASATILAFLRSHSGTNPAVGVKILSCTDSMAPQYNFPADAFKVISGGWTSDAELWMRKPTNYGQYAIYELSRFCGNGASLPVYNDGATWQSATPTGTVNNVSSDGVVSATGKLSVYATTGGTPTIAAIGDDTNKNLNITTKGTGTVKINSVDAATISDSQTFTNKTLVSPKIGTSILDTSGNTLLSLATYPSAVNYLRLANRGTGLNPYLLVDGADSNIDLQINPKGSGSLMFYVTTGQTPTIKADGQDANHNLNLLPKGTGVVQANGVEVVTTSGAQTLTNKTLTTPKVRQIAAEDGGTAIYLESNGASLAHLQINRTASATNLFANSLFGATDVSLGLKSKGSSPIGLSNTAGTPGMTIYPLGPNYLIGASAALGQAPYITATSSTGVGDDNVSLNLKTKGTGTVQANGVDVVTTTGTQSLSNKTLVSPTITGTPAGIAKQAQVDVFTPLGANYVTDKQVSSNVVTLTTLTAHGYQVGDKVWINGIDSAIELNLVTSVTITSIPTATTFTFARSTADIAPATVRPYGNVFKLQTWTKPSGAVSVKFTLCGPGGGGGSGARRATTSNRTGGGGGGGGGWQEVTVPASDVPDTAMFVSVPAGAYGGLPVTTDDTDGMVGGRSYHSTRVSNLEISYISTLNFNANPGYGGLGGSTGTTVAGGGGAVNTQFAGGAGGAGNNSNGSIGSNATYVGGGGGGGGGAAASSTSSAAGGGAASIFAVRSLSGTFVSPGNGTSTMDATTNTSYYPVIPGLPGIGGGGGAYKTATNGGNGGDATNHNAGGGGGGASDNGYNSGAGGKGADGCVVITTYF